jgi:hypothetical protein
MPRILRQRIHCMDYTAAYRQGSREKCPTSQLTFNAERLIKTSRSEPFKN